MFNLYTFWIDLGMWYKIIGYPFFMMFSWLLSSLLAGGFPCLQVVSQPRDPTHISCKSPALQGNSLLLSYQETLIACSWSSCQIGEHICVGLAFPGGTSGKTQVGSLGWEDPQEEGTAVHSNILAWKIPWTEEPGGLLPIGLQRAGHDWSDLACTHELMHAHVGLFLGSVCCFKDLCIYSYARTILVWLLYLCDIMKAGSTMPPGL